MLSSTLKKIFLLAIPFLLAFQIKEDYKKLTINDYTGTPDLNSGFKALTRCGVFFKIVSIEKCGNENIKYKVETVCNLDSRSWINKSAIKTKEEADEMLSHEQGHFDLNMARKNFLKFDIERKCFNRKTAKMEIDSIYKSLYLHYDSLQIKYDQETDHMRNKEAQRFWKKHIEDLYIKSLTAVTQHKN